MHMLIILKCRIDDEQVQFARVRQHQILRRDGLAARGSERERQGHRLIGRHAGCRLKPEHDRRTHLHDGNELRIVGVTHFQGSFPFCPKIHVI